MEKSVKRRWRFPWIVMALVFAGVLLFFPAGLAREIVVTSTADSGAETLRWALQQARRGDTILFDTSVFSPDAPATIYPRSELPPIRCGHLTIDASDAGVIIDGTHVPGDWNNGLQVYSDHNTVMGLQIVNFAGSGIACCSGSHNTIGGDRSVGSGPLGQGNLVSKNSIGIDICDYGTSYNVIQGNLIGTDANGITAWGNSVIGIYLEEGVHHNTIGPDNVIAHNDVDGILITGQNATNNTVTQNSIYDNVGRGISLMGGGNTALEPPFVFGFNLASGIVSGTTCADCKVEIFSDEGDEGRQYEGKTTADASGAFVFVGRRPLSGPHLTATTADNLGNTSGFSVYTVGEATSTWLQESTGLPVARLRSRRSQELADNRIGGMWNGFWQPFDMVDVVENEILDLGLKRARLTINSLEQVTEGKQAADMSQPEMSVIPEHDEIFTTVAAAGVEITYTLIFWDKESMYTEEVLSGPRFKSEDQIRRYLEFARFIVDHFRDRVQRFEIWNEPDLGTPGQAIALEDYLELVRRVIPVVQAEDPTAEVQVGGTTGLRNAESRDYLFAILESDIMPLVDVVCWHPLYGESPLHEAAYYYAYPLIIREIKGVAEAHGFTGEYEADEIVWWTHGEINDQPWRYSTIESAKYTARTALLHLGMDVTAILGGISGRSDVFSTIQNLCTVMAGHEAIGMPVEIDIDYEPIAYCAFRYPNGDRILAVWTDGIAQDEDLGVPATITFPGLTAETVTGIDVLHGFEQELVFETNGGKTLVRNLLVRDYPILIKLSDVTMGPGYEESVGDGFHRLGDVDAAAGSGSPGDRDGDGVSDEEDYCPDYPGDLATNGC